MQSLTHGDFRVKNHPTRNFGLDILRAAAIGLVLLAHGLTSATAHSSLRLPLETGAYFGVELFFVLSGFLIGGILLRVISDAGSFSALELRDFWMRRWFRTLPNYFLFLILNAALWLFVPEFAKPPGASPPVGAYLVFLQNFTEPITKFFGVSWSLAIEEWFYLTFPVLLLFLLRSLRGTARAVWLAILFFALVPVLMRVFAQPADWDDGLRKIVLFRLDSVMYGVAAAAIQFFHPAWWSRRRALVWPGLALLAGVFLFFQMMPDSEQFIVDHAALRALLFPATSLGFMLLLPWFCAVGARGGVFGFAVTRMSRWSYSMYLCHPPLMFLISSGWKYFFPDNRWLAAKGGVWLVAVFALSALLFRFFEKPMMDLRDRPFFQARRAPRKDRVTAAGGSSPTAAVEGNGSLPVSPE